jgi:hypothetical protein
MKTHVNQLEHKLVRRFTKPLLYQLSYVGVEAKRAKIAFGSAADKRLYRGSTNVSPISRRAIRSV